MEPDIMQARAVRELRSHWGGTHEEGYGGRLSIRRVPLTRDGYSKGKFGRYYGVGAPLWRITNRDDGYVDFEVRAADKPSVIAMVKAAYPGAVGRRRR